MDKLDLYKNTVSLEQPQDTASQGQAINVTLPKC